MRCEVRLCFIPAMRPAWQLTTTLDLQRLISEVFAFMFVLTLVRGQAHLHKMMETHLRGPKKDAFMTNTPFVVNGWWQKKTCNLLSFNNGEQ
jgi:hypothetical protein